MINNAYDINGNPLLKPVCFRVCAFNVGNFSLGQSGTPAGTDSMYNDFIETFQKCNPNIYMFSEWDIYWTGTTSIDTVLGFLKPYKTSYMKPSGWAGQMNYSDYPIKSEYHKDFDESTNAGYFVDNVIQIGGKDIHFICTHFAWQSMTARNAQIQEILDYIDTNNIEYYVIGGDMNLGSDGQGVATDATVARTSVNLLESDGAVSVQGGGWGCRDNDGFFNTYGTEGWYTPAESMHMADNVVVSSNIRIKNVFVVVTDASDHNALCVDLEIL